MNIGGGVATTLLSHVYISIWVEGIWKKYTIYLSIATNLATYFHTVAKRSESYFINKLGSKNTWKTSNFLLKWRIRSSVFQFWETILNN